MSYLMSLWVRSMCSRTRWGLALCKHCKHNCQERGDPKKKFFHDRSTVSNTDPGAKINGYQTAVVSAVLSGLLVYRLRRGQRILQGLGITGGRLAPRMDYKPAAHSTT